MSCLHVRYSAMNNLSFSLLSLLQLEKLRTELQRVDTKITEAETMLKFADPEGYFRSGTRAAAEARSRGLRQHALEQQRAQEEVRP